MKLDDFDWKILALLQDNARLSYAELGRLIGLSPSAVGDRVARLEQEEIIEKHISIVNFKKVGFMLSAYISMEFNHHRYQSFLKCLSAFPEIVSCSRITGKNCIIMKVVLKDSLHLEQMVDRLSEFGNSYTSVILSDVVEAGPVPDSRSVNLI